MAYDPSEHTVEEVTSYLEEHPDEREAVLAAERDGKARKGVLEAGTTGEDTTPPSDPQEGAGDANGTADTTTKGATFAEAAEAAEPDAKGYIGTSPERERTGRADKGLSQQSPGVMNDGKPVPDSRPQVDDSEALKG